jgi:hypothetical protein
MVLLHNGLNYDLNFIHAAAYKGERSKKIHSEVFSNREKNTRRIKTGILKKNSVENYFFDFLPQPQPQPDFVAAFFTFLAAMLSSFQISRSLGLNKTLALSFIIEMYNKDIETSMKE